MSSQLQRMFASAAALALGAVALVPLTAHASDPVHGNIVDKHDASITIHKMESGSLQNAASVTADTPDATGDYINGVPFNIYRLNLDLTKPEGWNPLTNLTVPEGACQPDGTANFTALTGVTQDTSTSMQTVTTHTNGSIKAAVRTGAYLVCEANATNATNKAGAAVKVVKKAKPFIATVPFPHPGGQGWLYDVHVYPKNTVVEGALKTVTVTEPGLQRANGVTVEFATKIPSLAQGEYFKYFAIVDPMPRELSSPTGYQVSIDQVTLEFNEGVDYNVTHSTSAPQNNAVAVSLTKAGLAKIAPYKNRTLKVSFKATMNALPADGQANNAGWVYVTKAATEVADNQAPAPIVWPSEVGGTPASNDGVAPTRTKNTVGTTWGKFSIEKIDARRHETKLANATFKLYVAKNQQTCDQNNLETEGAAISVGTKSEFTTGPNGQVTIDGVHLHTKSVDGDNPDPQKTRCFIIEETVSPAGYVLPVQAKTAVLVNAQTTDQVVQVTNTQVTDLPELPLTGAAGQLILMAIGSALMLGSIGSFMVLRKHHNKRI